MFIIELDPITILERLFLAALLGGLVGWEREWRKKQAGLKTHVLVSVGSALIMLTSIYGFGDLINHPNTRFDPARLAAQVVSGIGFLGAGAIMRHSNTVVSGLTTAATLWVVAAIGLSVGTGFYIPAIATTVIVLIITVLLRSLESKFALRGYRTLRLRIEDQPGKLGEISKILGEEGINIRGVSVSEKSEENRDSGVPIKLLIKVSPRKKLIDIVERLQNIDGMKKVEYDDNEGR